jgi:hypothetical protein
VVVEGLDTSVEGDTFEEDIPETADDNLVVDTPVVHNLEKDNLDTLLFLVVPLFGDNSLHLLHSPFD